MAEITIRISDKALRIALACFGAVLLLWGFSHLWSSGVFRPKYQIRMFVPDAEGLQVGSAVRLNGIPVGIVSSIELAGDSTDPNRKIGVALRIEKRFQDRIRADSIASLLRDGLLGNRFVNIHQGFSGPPLNPGQEIRVGLVREGTVTDFLNVLRKNTDCQGEESKSLGSKLPPATK